MAEPITIQEAAFRNNQLFVENQLRSRVALTPSYLDEEGSPSLSIPSTNFFSATGLRVSRGASEIGSASYIPGIGSGAEIFARASRKTDRLLPIPEQDGLVYTPEGAIQRDQANGKQLFEAFDPFVQDLFEMYGAKDNFTEDIDYDETVRRFNEISNSISINQRLDRYAEERPFLYGLAGAAAFGSNVVTDPLTYVTLGVGSAARKAAITQAGKIAAKAGATQSVRTGVKQSFMNIVANAKANNISLTQSMILNVADGNKVAVYGWLGSAGAASGLGFDYLTQRAEYANRAGLGYEQGTFGEEYSLARAGVSTLLGGFLASVGARTISGRQLVPTNMTVASLNPNNLASRMTLSQLRNGSVRAEATANLQNIAGWDRVEAYMDGVYSRDDADIVDIYLDDWANSTDPNKPTETEVIDFIMKVPTPNELADFVSAVPTNRPKDTAVSRAVDNLEAKEAQVREARRTSSKDTRKLEKERDKMLEDLQSARSALFFHRSPTKINPQTGVAEINEAAKAAAKSADVISTPTTVVDIYDAPQNRVKVLDDRLAEDRTKMTEAGMSTYHRGLIRRNIYDLFAIIGGAFTPAGTARKITKASPGSDAEMLDLQIAQLISLVDSNGTETRVLRPDGTAVKTQWVRTMRDRHKRVVISRELKQLTKGLDPEAAQNFYRKAMQVRSTGTKSADAKINRAAEIVGDFYDDYSRRGSSAGAMKRVIGNYVKVRVKQGLDGVRDAGSVHRMALAYRDYLWKHYYQSGDELHLGTLAEIGVIDRNTGKLTAGYSAVSTSMPKKLADLNPTYADKYNNTIMLQLEEEAKVSFNRKMGRKASGEYDPIVDLDKQPYVYRERSAGARKIEQDFYLSDEAYVTGLVDYDLPEMLRMYDNSFGHTIRETETLREAFGTPARWEDVIDVLEARNRNTAASDAGFEARQTAIKSLKANLDMIRNRGLETDALNPLYAFQDMLTNMRTALTNAGLVITMSPEIAMTISRTLFRPSEIPTAIKSVLKGLPFGGAKEEINMLGLNMDFEDGISRFFGDNLNVYAGGNKTLTAAVDTTRKLSDLARTVFFEKFVTERLRLVTFNVEHHRAARYMLKNIDEKFAELQRLGGQFTDTSGKEFKAAARAAGFGSDWQTARDLREIGMFTPEGLDALKAVRARTDGKHYTARDYLSLITLEKDPVARKQLEFFYNEMHDYIRNRTDSIIVTASPSTRLQLNKTPPYLRPHIQFLSYVTAWFNNFLFRGSRDPLTLFAAGIGAHVMGEAISSAFRDVVYNGKSPETVIEDWEENSAKKTAAIISRVPFTGAGSDFVTPFMQAISGDRIQAPAGAPSLSLISNIARTGQRNVKAALEGEFDAGDLVRDLARFNPLQGWYVQGIGRAIHGFEDVE
jgi:hypothetical protein